MTAIIIDGKAIAEGLRKQIAEEVSGLKNKPGLAVVLVGEDPASQVYVRNKAKMTAEVGMQSFEHILPVDTSERALIRLVEQLNNNPAVQGILVQLPLPKHISENAVIEAIAPEKDVDGFHVVNSGKLATGQEGLVPCTPLGCIILLKQTLGDLSGKHAVVIGRSNIVGKPMAALLLKENCTVTVVHSKTPNPEKISAQADIVVAAIGKPRFVKKEWVKPGACVIDVGINRDENNKLCGDVDFASVSEIAGAITPVPGGVGPMTIACLLKNTLTAYKQQMSK
jgi:methylenetetrahydrofolate dehydrogenase (NADP+)/methenyltetrahydrofolate cyclohydrolase